MQKEICSNGVDDDGDGKVDCDDSECQVTTAMSIPSSSVSQYNCLGSSQTGDVGVGNYYCGVAESDSTVGLCCESGYGPAQDLDGDWFCTESDPCYDGTVDKLCQDVYGDPITPWLSSTPYDSTPLEWCVDPVAGLACCQVVSFGETNYYSTSGNVKVY